MAATISEKNLVEYSKAKVVEYIRLVAIELQDKCSYELWVKGQWNSEECQLINFRHREPRLWASLDRAVSHIKRAYEFRGRIYLDV